MSVQTVSTMSSRQRWLAALRHQHVDRLPFWPKLNQSYAPGQTAPFNGMGIDAIHNWIGSDQHIGISSCVREVRRHTSVRTEHNAQTMTTTYRTPHGQTTLVRTFDAPSQSWHPIRFPVTCVEDIKLMTAIYEDATADIDHDVLAEARMKRQTIGETGITHCGIGQSPLMHWVEWLAGIENAHLLLMDHPAEVEALFAAMHRLLLRRTELFCEHHPVDLLYFIENTSTTLISPQQYQRYCLEHIGQYANIARQAGRDIILHMCGHLKMLLDDLETLPVAGFEAFTAPTLGNTTLLDGRTHCPTKTLIGGTHAMLWLEPAEVIIDYIRQRLDELPHHRGIVVTSAGVMTPRCPPQRIKTVCDWLRNYPLRF